MYEISPKFAIVLDEASNEETKEVCIEKNKINRLIRPNTLLEVRFFFILFCISSHLLNVIVSQIVSFDKCFCLFVDHKYTIKKNKFNDNKKFSKKEPNILKINFLLILF